MLNYFVDKYQSLNLRNNNSNLGIIRIRYDLITLKWLSTIRNIVGKKKFTGCVI